jgi:biotin transport system substrate-specific component
MSLATTNPVLREVGQNSGALRLAEQVLWVVLGVAVLAIAAKIKIPLWPSPVPVTLGTFAVLGIGAAYGPRLGLITILAYMAVGALGYDVFANSSADRNGWSYMIGGTGGYLVGYVLATLALGWFARRGWDRSVGPMALAMLVGNVLIYLPGVAWLYVLVDGGMFNAEQFATPWAQTLAWGITPFLIGDAIKLVAAALVLPALWKLVGSARA